MTLPKVGRIGFEQGEKNRQRVWDYFFSSPFDTQKDCALHIGLSAMAVGRAVKAIRDGWEPKPTNPIDGDMVPCDQCGSVRVIDQAYCPMKGCGVACDE